MALGIVGRFVPDPGVVLAASPLLILGVQSDDGATLGAGKVVVGDPDGPAETAGLGDDLVRRVDGLRAADAGMASISATVANSFMPIGVVFRRRRVFSSATSSAQS